MADDKRLQDEELLAELGVSLESEKQPSYSKEEERIIAGFEDIQRFVDEHGRLPQHGEERDIFERMYAVRLDRIVTNETARVLLQSFDTTDILGRAEEGSRAQASQEIEDEDLLAELGIGQIDDEDDITQLKHVRTIAERNAPHTVAERKPVQDFEPFQALFEGVKAGLKNEVLKTKKVVIYNLDIRAGDFFILNGQLLYIAETFDKFVSSNGQEDYRLRAIYSNKTESNLLRTSLLNALNKDKTGRQIILQDEGPNLFSDEHSKDDIASGTVYVLRSNSTLPFIAEHREVIHKIGVTGGKVNTRLANVQNAPTFLLADVEVVATYKLANINRVKFEALIHRVFEQALLEIELEDRFGRKVKPREWFLVPLNIIDEAIDKIKDGTIVDYVYDPKSGSLVN